MGASVSLMVPSWQLNKSRPPTQRYANTETRNELKRRLLNHDFSQLSAASSANPNMRDAIISVIGSKGMDASPEFETTMVEDAPITPRAAGIELLLSVGTRLRNQNIYNFFCVVLSILFLAANLNENMWHLLCMMGLIFSKRWTVELAKELGDEVRRSRPTNASTNVGFGVSDNKAYFVKTAYVHADGIEGAEQPQRANGEFLYTVNNLEVPVLIEEGERDIIIEKG
jgi:hypothetical protein